MSQRRKSRTDQEWLDLIQECRSSGMTDAAWCELHELQSLKANLEETLNEFRRQFFGVSSEKVSSSDKGDVESGAEETSATEPETVKVKGYVREKKPKSKRADLYENLPVREVIIPLTDEQKLCEYCNAQMKVIGHTQVREELRITPAVVERIRYMQEVAICPECKKDGDGTIVKAIAPTALMPHSPASPSAVAYVMFHKTFMGTPYYRQEMAMFQLGLKLPRETMANWYITCAEEYFYPIYERMHALLLGRAVIHADETTCQVLREKGKAAESTSYMWIYLSGSDGLPSIVLYDYQPGRAGSHPQQFLEGFNGLLQCDGYQGYNKVDDVILVCCLAHCRRKFYEAIPAGRRKKIKLLAYCNKLFFIERELKDLPADNRKAKRLDLEPPVWEGFWKWLDSLNPSSGSKLAKAVTYARNHKETLCNYLLDGRCEISNNAAERRAKSYAIGRKAFLFHTSEAGAGASAVIYSMVETAKANNLNVF
jgi:transposase